MSSDRVAQRWEAARVKANELRGLEWSVREALALVYYVIAVGDDVEVETVSLRALRYRLMDLGRLHREVAGVLPGPAMTGPQTVTEGKAAMAQMRLTELDGDQGEFTGPAPVEGKIWKLWDTLQAPHGIPAVDTLPSDMITESAYNTYTPTGSTVFVNAVRQIVQDLDRLLLPASGALKVGATVEVTSGIHAGRAGRVTAVTWGVDDEQRICTETPASFEITFDDQYAKADLAPAMVVALPEWDYSFAVVHAGEPLPTQWNASVFLAAPSSPPMSWHEEAVERLRQTWDTPGYEGRLAVLIPQPRDGGPLCGDHAGWTERALAWADEIIAEESPDTSTPPQLTPAVSADPRDTGGRLTVFRTDTGPADDQDALPWARRHAVPTASSAAEAVEMAVQRIGRGRRRTGGERAVPLLVAASDAYFHWSSSLIEARASLAGAHVEWLHRDEDSEIRTPWWVLHARIRHADHQITDELVVAHTSCVSVVAYHPQKPWTDTEVVLLPVGTHHPVRPASSYSSDKQVLRLPTITVPLNRGGDAYDRGWAALAEELGLVADRARLRVFGHRDDSALLSASRSLVSLELTQEEIDALREHNEMPLPGGPVVCRVADLLAGRASVCDWATVGLITRAVLPTWPPASGDFSPHA